MGAGHHSQRADRDVDGTQMIDFSADGKTLYMLDSRERDKAAFFAVEWRPERPPCSRPTMKPTSGGLLRRPRRSRRAPNKDRARWHAVDASARGSGDLARYGPGDVEIIRAQFRRSLGDGIL